MKKCFLLAGIFAAVLFTSCKKGGGDENPPPRDEEQKDIAAIDNAVQSLMTTYNVPGVSIAITKNENLVYVKSYGKMSASDNTPVSNNSLFRIASVSKPITGVGIMKLLEANKLTLDSKVFGTGSILGNDFPSTQLASVSDITVRQLLHHSTGSWPNNGTDPMFKQQSYNFSQLISWTLDTYNNSGPRNVYKYSNFGYCILGRIIEKLSGKTYEQFIKDEVLAPAGITSMQIGGSTLAERKPNEVIYNGQGGENPYIYNVPRMDAHGGWIASATDLARFMVKVDGFPGKTDILKPATIATMTTMSIPSSNYACGWSVNNNNNWWHLGSLPGNVSQIVRSGTGYSWVILTNTRNPSNAFTSAIDGLLWPFMNNSTPFQNIDQF